MNGFYFRDLWRWEGALDRGPFVLAGAILFAIKYNLDRLIAEGIFHRPRWSIFEYPIPFHQQTVPLQDDLPFFATLMVVALPFIWAGAALTVRRLRSAGLPIWLVVFFFPPFINLFFFLLLALLPSKAQRETPPQADAGRLKAMLDRWIPDHPMGSAALALLLNTLLALPLIYIATETLGDYGWTLFVGVPFFLGLSAVLLHGYHRPRNLGSCLIVALCSVALISALLFALAMEGVICLLMAAPLGILVALTGGVLGYFIQKQHWANLEAPRLYCAALIALPVLMAAERLDHPPAPLIAVRSAIEVNAPPEEVWRHVVSFPELPPPTELLFRAGVAYPLRAQIQGTGVGAIRHCVFSTGAFVEPIEVWDAPRLLRFSVTSNPPPMQEWTPFAAVHPPHLNGFLVSRAGQFRLEPLPGGRTRLEGTTWYQHHLWPASYWTPWSDFIIHRIHLRVLHHVQQLAEADAAHR